MRIILFTILIFLPFSSYAEIRQLTTGTGFFLNKEGYLITNAHVVKACKSYRLQGNVTTKDVQLIALDEADDLALLKAPYAPYGAPLRNGNDIKPSDNVAVVGFPGMRVLSGEYVVGTAQILSLKGPNNEPGLLQFTSAIAKGNSGGPLMDASGNVIGVVRAMVTFHPLAHPEITTRVADLAITMPVLKAFLDAEQVSYDDGINLDANIYNHLDPNFVEGVAKDYIIGVICEH